MDMRHFLPSKRTIVDADGEILWFQSGLESRRWTSLTPSNNAITLVLLKDRSNVERPFLEPPEYGRMYGGKYPEMRTIFRPQRRL